MSEVTLRPGQRLAPAAHYENGLLTVHYYAFAWKGTLREFDADMKTLEDSVHSAVEQEKARMALIPRGIQ